MFRVIRGDFVLGQVVRNSSNKLIIIGKNYIQIKS